MGGSLIAKGIKCKRGNDRVKKIWVTNENF
jgi:hypothetical protein